jgi:hypothetical protein
MADFFGNRYWPPHYFPQKYFGTESFDPNAMFGLAAGSATAVGLLTVNDANALRGSAVGVATVTGTLLSLKETKDSGRPAWEINDTNRRRLIKKMHRRDRLKQDEAEIEFLISNGYI